jgi:hypothetical protein
VKRSAFRAESKNVVDILRDEVKSVSISANDVKKFTPWQAANSGEA